MAYRPTEKTRARKQAQCQKLLNAAVALVAEEGFQGLKISDIARRAELATGSFYKHFKSKEELCAEVFRTATVREVEKVREAALDDADLSCTQRLLNAIDVFAQRAIQGRQMAYALIAEPVDPMVEKERLIYRQAYADIYSELVQSGISTGEFPPQIATISAAAIVGALSESLVGPLTTAVQNNADIEQRDLIKAIQAFCLRAVTGTTV